MSGLINFMTIKICLNCKKEFNVRGIKRAKVAMFCSHTCKGDSRSFKVVEGSRNNMLVIIKEVEPEIQFNYDKKTPLRKVYCKCDCGNFVTTRLTSFRTGYAKSCGCIGKIGRFDDKVCISRHPLHRVWSNMIQRCTNINNGHYKYYGGSGVTVCEKWLNSYQDFYDWAIKNGWSMGLKLDKDIIGKLLYSPETCVFITGKQNANFTRGNNAFIIDGVRFTMAQLSEKYKISRTSIERNLKKGEPIEIAVTKKRKDVKHNT